MTYGRAIRTAQLHGGPLDGQLVQASLRDDMQQPERIIGVPVPVLDEQAETFSWDTANYFTNHGQNARRRQGEPWHYTYTRTLRGYPAYSREQ